MLLISYGNYSGHSMSTIPKFTGIDHIHIYVPDRAAAAKWYQQVLGFSIVESLLPWTENEQGPLTLEDSSGLIHLALFKVAAFKPGSALAFGASGEEFLSWKRHLEKHVLLKRLSDHKLGWSLYFQDPYGNQHEISTQDYQQVAGKLHLDPD